MVMILAGEYFTLNMTFKYYSTGWCLLLIDAHMRWFGSMVVSYLIFIIFWLFQPFFSIEFQLAEAADKDVSNREILVGTSVPLTGHASYLGQGIVTGMNAYFNHINSQGGINGRKIKLTAYDDDYNPPLMISNVKRMIDKDQVFALIGLVGTPTTLTVVEACEKQKIPLLFPFTIMDPEI